MAKDKKEKSAHERVIKKIAFFKNFSDLHHADKAAGQERR